MKWRVQVEGENFLVALDSAGARKHGFFITAHLEAEREEDATELALSLVRTHARLRSLVQNPADDPPRLRIDMQKRIEDWPPDVARPLTGLSWYEEKTA